MKRPSGTVPNRTFFVAATVSLLLACFAFVSYRLPAAHAAPATMNFQGRLLDTTGTPVTDGLYNMQFKLYDASSGGTLLWSEIRENNGSDYRVQVTNGLFTTKLGQRTALSASVFSGNSVYFEITQATPATATCSTASCATWESPMAPRHQLSTSAYAFNSETLDGIDSTGFLQAAGNNTLTGTNLFSVTNANALKVQNASAVSLLNVDTSTMNITIGSAGTASSLTLVGSTTANRPASPTEGMMYYDTDTKQLLVYSTASGSGKWQADKSEAILVAASNSSASDKAAADYVATGTGDQSTINTALTAADPAGSGRKTGKVYLFAGTYTVSASVSIPNNTTLAGAGNGTRITIPGNLTYSMSAVTNTDTVTGTNVTVRDLKLDGNKAGQGDTVDMVGIDFNGMGGGTGTSARQGAQIMNVTSLNWYATSGTNCRIGAGICLRNSSNNILSNNVTHANMAFGIYLLSSSNNTISGNTSQGNTTGIALDSSSNGNTISGNTTQGNGDGIYLSSSSNNTVTGNSAQGNNSRGIYLYTNSNANVITGNKIHDNGGAGSNGGITTFSSDSNTITGNSITDTSCTTNCYAINISNSTSDTNYLSSNTFSTSSGTATINDAGTGTIYAGQSKTQGGLDILFKQANSTAAFSIQNGSGTNILNLDTSGNIVTVGVSDATAAVLVLDTKNTAGDPTCTNGGMYYNSSTSQFRFCQNGNWVNMQAGVDVQTYTSGANTWTKPSGVSAVMVIMCGAGGGGGGGSTSLNSGAGGGGGAHVERLFLASDLSSTVTATVGSGGTGAVAGGTGGNGGASTFGSYAYAGGGAGGPSGNQGGGGGGGVVSSTNNLGGENPKGGSSGIGWQGGSGGSVGSTGGNSQYGGGGGGGARTNASQVGMGGGSSGVGGTGGGSGGVSNGIAGGAGGAARSYTAGGGASGGTGAAGGAGTAATSTGCGTGGGGGGGSSTTGWSGGTGGAGGGGGGGGGAGTTAGGLGGAGGSGKIWVISW